MTGAAADQAFDASWYLRRYPDVRKACGIGDVESATAHYERHGRAEGRDRCGKGPTFIVHIGPHKTASSYIQVALQRDQQELESLGILVPDAWKGSPGLQNHTGVIHNLHSGDLTQFDHQVDALVGRAPANILMSAEDLCSLSSGSIAQLGHQLSSYKVTIVYYLRSANARLYSLWQEAVRHGSGASLGGFLAQHLVAPSRSNVINPLICLDRYADVFGVDNLQLVSYDDVVASGEDIYKHFRRVILAIPASPTFPASLQVSHRVHQSPHYVDTEVARMLNMVGDQEGLSRLGMTYLDNLTTFRSAELNALVDSYASSIELDDAIEPFASSKYRLYRKYLGRIVDPPPTRFFQDSRMVARSVNSACAFNSKITDALRQLAQPVMALRRAQPAAGA